MAQHSIVGKEGEAFAVQYLEQKGYTILACNYRYQKAEIDIVAACGNTIVFVEVKTRSSSKFGLPEESVTPKKQQFISNAATNFLAAINLNKEVRFDIISLSKAKAGYEIFHIEDAFFPIG